jgi:hypothetical protein
MSDQRATRADSVPAQGTEKGASDKGFQEWGGEDLNLRPTDYEFPEAHAIHQEEEAEKAS